MSNLEIYKQHESVILLTGRIPPALMPKTIQESILVLASYPEQFYATLKPASIKDCLLSPVCTLGAFNRATSNDITGDMTVRATVLIMLADVVSFFNVGKTMTENQLAQTADLIIDNYGYLKIDDFKYCFTCAKKMMYGQVYDRLDGNVIIGWIEQYITERTNTADNFSYSNHASMKASERNSESFMEISRKHKNQ